MLESESSTELQKESPKTCSGLKGISRGKSRHELGGSVKARANNPGWAMFQDELS
jgi:hypothetical protein